MSNTDTAFIDTAVAKDLVTNRNVRISASFNKLLRTQEYESERIEVQAEMDLIDGENLELAMMELQAQLEYAAYTQLLAKRQISQEEFSLRKKELDDGLKLMSGKVATFQPANN